MAIASSGAVSIGSAAGSGRSINVEVGRTQNTANTSMTDVVTAAVTGSTPRGSGTVTQAQPHAFSEWHSYVHTQDFGTPTYYVRTGSGTADFCIANEITVTDYEATAVCNTVFYFKLNGTVVEFYMDPDHTVQYFPQNVFSASRTVSARDTGGNVASFTGSWTNGFTPMKIAQLDVGQLANWPGGLQARISASVFSGVGGYDSAVSGYTIGNGGTNSTDWRTPHASTLYGISPAAWTLPQACYGSQDRDPYHSIICEVKATGYNTKTLNTFVSYHGATAISDDCV